MTYKYNKEDNIDNILELNEHYSPNNDVLKKVFFILVGVCFLLCFPFILRYNYFDALIKSVGLSLAILGLVLLLYKYKRIKEKSLKYFIRSNLIRDLVVIFSVFILVSFIYIYHIIISAGALLIIFTIYLIICLLVYFLSGLFLHILLNAEKSRKITYIVVLYLLSLIVVFVGLRFWQDFTTKEIINMALYSCSPRSNSCLAKRSLNIDKDACDKSNDPERCKDESYFQKAIQKNDSSFCNNINNTSIISHCCFGNGGRIDLSDQDKMICCDEMLKKSEYKYSHLMRGCVSKEYCNKFNTNIIECIDELMRNNWEGGLPEFKNNSADLAWYCLKVKELTKARQQIKSADFVRMCN